MDILSEYEFSLTINIYRDAIQHDNAYLRGGRDGIVEETPVHIYYAYLKPTWGYGFNSLVVLCVG